MSLFCWPPLFPARPLVVNCRGDLQRADRSFIGVASFWLLADHNETIAIVVVLGMPLAFAAIGLLFGQRRAFSLRSQAQQLLILVAIELNTRRPAAVAPSATLAAPATVAAAAGA